MTKDREALVGAVAAELRAYQTAVDALDHMAAKILGLNRTDQRCLDLLLARGALTVGQLAAASGLSTPATTIAVDRLENAGYAWRSRDTSDRRRVLVSPTTAARRAQEEVYGPIGAAGVARLARYRDEELAMLGEFLSEAREVTEEHTARLREQADRSGRRARRD